MKNSDTRINRDFNRTFYREESKELFGKNFLNFFYLVLILVITFLAIGFANGSLKYLKRKMDDPFIKWVNIDIPYTLANQIPDYIRQLDVDSIKNNYMFQSCQGFNQLSIYFFKNNSDDIVQFTGRTIEHDNQILTSIISEKNETTGNSWKDEYDIGLIVTRQLLDKLDYNNKIPAYLVMSYPVMDKKYIAVPIPVVAVVRDLPGNNLFACTPYFYDKRMSRYYPFDVSSESYQQELAYFIEGERKSASGLARSVINALQGDSLYRHFNDTLILPNNKSIKQGYNIILSFKPDLSDFSLVSRFDSIFRSEKRIQGADVIRIYNYDLSGFEKMTENYDNLSIYFTSLDRIRDFSSFLFTSRNLKIDMSQIESKENYNFVSKLTIFISGFLVIFSVISIVLFLSNILKVHITKIKSNLGTFKAFGLSNPVIVRIYSFLSLRFLFLAIIIALVISLLVGETGLFRLLFRISGTIIDENFKYFNLFADIKTYLALTAIIIISIIVLPWNIYRMLNKTPGDLIYKRD